jgi:hypothetical protein
MEVTTWLADVSSRLERSDVGEAVRLVPNLYADHPSIGVKLGL